MNVVGRRTIGWSRNVGWERDWHSVTESLHRVIRLAVIPEGKKPLGAQDPLGGAALNGF
jgi:hypothetical protein